MQKLKSDLYNCFKVLMGILLFLSGCSLFVSALAQDPWVVVYPGNPAYSIDMNIVHFRDEKVGWASGYSTSWKSGTLILHTNDGWMNWQEEWTDFPYEHAFFVNTLEGWTFRSWPEPVDELLMADIELYHSIDGGLSWQSLPGNITEIVVTSDLKPIYPFERKAIRQAFFIDAQKGWLIGNTSLRLGKGKLLFSTGLHALDNDLLSAQMRQAFSDNGIWLRESAWVEIIEAGNKWGIINDFTEYYVEKKADKLDVYETIWLAGNLILATNDGGKTWKGQIDAYPALKISLIDIESHKRLIDIDFVSYTNGWILAVRDWLYRASDGGDTWEKLVNRDFWYIDFIDTQNGWSIGSGVWATHDGGNTWVDISPAQPLQSVEGYTTLCFINADEGWTVGSKNILWEPGKNIYEVSIFHTTDGGRTWQVEWKTEMEGGIAYLGYDEATSAIWAGGTSGLLMKRLVNPPATSVSPKGKLSITWGKIKSETP